MKQKVFNIDSSNIITDSSDSDMTGDGKSDGLWATAGCESRGRININIDSISELWTETVDLAEYEGCDETSHYDNSDTDTVRVSANNELWDAAVDPATYDNEAPTTNELWEAAVDPAEYEDCETPTSDITCAAEDSDTTISTPCNTSNQIRLFTPVSYTHLTLPTICSV